MRVYKVTVDGSCYWMTNDSQDVFDEVQSLMDNGDAGEMSLTITTKEMSDEEYNALPEFEGWF